MPQEPTLMFQSFRDVVLEDHAMRIVHGSDFGSADGEFVVHQGRIDLPDNFLAPRATVLLNGWSLEYDKKDHHVGHLATQITGSRIVGNQLVWDARGMIRDDADSSFQWHYYYTIIMWDAGNVNCITDHENIRPSAESRQGFPIAAVSSYYQNDLYNSSNTIAVLPRGFHCIFPGRSGLLPTLFGGFDRHLYQFGYNLGQSETFVQQGKQYGTLPIPSLQTSLVDSGYVSWDSQTIFRDNSSKEKHFVFFENSTLAGNGVGLIQPPFMILPAIRGQIGSGTGGEVSREHVIENIPFDYAVPMLTGWNLDYDFGDQHVTKIGIWLTDISFARESDKPGGTLRYRVNTALYDKDRAPGFSFEHRVSILGFNSDRPVAPPTPSTPPNRDN